MKSGNTREEVADYVRENRDIVIAVYDLTDGKKQKSRKQKNALQSILSVFPVPVVMVGNDA